MRSHILRLGCIAAGILLFVGSSSLQAVAMDSDQWAPNPIFDGVKQVFVHVHYIDPESKEEQAALPAPLRKENIEALLMQLYTARFSSKNCTQETETGGELISSKHKYGCNDQPVVLIKGSDYDTYQSEQARKQPGTLNIEFQIVIDTSLKPPVAAAYIIQDRSDPQIPTEWEVTFPYIIPLNIDEKTIHKRLYGYIRNRIL